MVCNQLQGKCVKLRDLQEGMASHYSFSWELGACGNTLCAAASRPKDLLTSYRRQTTLPFTGRETGMFSWGGWGSLLKHTRKSWVHLFHWSMIIHLGKPPSLCWVQGKPWNQQHCKPSTAQMGIPTWSTDTSCVPTANVSISVHCVHSYSTHAHTHPTHTVKCLWGN